MIWRCSRLTVANRTGRPKYGATSAWKSGPLSKGIPTTFSPFTSGAPSTFISSWVFTIIKPSSDGSSNACPAASSDSSGSGLPGNAAAGLCFFGTFGANSGGAFGSFFWACAARSHAIRPTPPIRVHFILCFLVFRCRRVLTHSFPGSFGAWPASGEVRGSNKKSGRRLLRALRTGSRSQDRQMAADPFGLFLQFQLAEVESLLGERDFQIESND